MQKISKTLIALFTIVVFGASLVPKTTYAISLFTPFGGKIVKYNPAPPACVPITVAVSIATLGSINMTIEGITVGAPKPANLGLLRIDGVPIPGLTNIYRNYNYIKPGNWITGNSINVCDACGKVDEIPGMKAICSIPALSEILKAACGIAGEACPFGNLIHNLGTSLY